MPRQKQSNKDKAGDKVSAMADGWVKVVFAADIDEDTDQCPQCGEDYSECPCPGPTMEEYEYKYVEGMLYAKRKVKEE